MYPEASATFGEYTLIAYILKGGQKSIERSFIKAIKVFNINH